MAGKISSGDEEYSELLSRPVEIDDTLGRLMCLCRLGDLAAEGLHGLSRNPDSITFAFYFSLLRGEVETLQRMCGGEAIKASVPLL